MTSDRRNPLFGDPELGILRELESELLRELASASDEPSEAKQSLRRQSVRVTRRALMLVALVSLLGSSALAASLVLGKAKQTNMHPTVLSAGHAGGQRWQLEAYVFHAANCYALFAGQTESSRCIRAPGGSSVSAVSALLSGKRLIAGLAGAGTEQVHVQVAGDTTVVAAHPLSESSTRSAGVRSGLRWFVAVLPSNVTVDDASPALVVGQSAGGERGEPTLDCSLGGSSAACRRAAERIADGTPASH
jgi:hypothetical protein